jgi:UDP-N-acetylmuramoyl-tripeptide--D-alanyl-D-alanine ligase
LKALGLLFPPEHFGMVMIGSMYLSTIMAGLWLTLAVAVLWPQEKISQRRYLADAKRILGEVRPLIIGITGSYGKTGTKEILAAMLADRYNVFRPPGSYNTLMGVTRAIREGLRPYHEAFVVEMGAYREGSIQKLCDLTHPLHGIITIIGVQHLERYGSQKAIQRAKGELIRALPPDGVAVLNGDDPLCREIGDARQGEVIYFANSKPAPNSKIQNHKYVITSNIRITPTGSDFDLTFPDGEVLPVHLTLLGRAAISNAVAAAAMAERLGVSRVGIARVLSTMPHVRHRLEPRTGDGGITVIDDAFNSNPIGAEGALEVLGLATGGRRILVTPGMIELGDLEEESNREFGRQAAKSCDLAVLVGVKRDDPIRQGLLAGGFPAENIWVVPTLTEGLEKLKAYLKAGDTMLLENDLPDQYAGM